MSRRRCLQYGFLLGLLISFVAFFGRDAGSSRSLSDVLPALGASHEEGRVLVFVVDDPRAVERVRRALAVDRVVYATDDAVAAIEGRIVAVDHDAASRAVNAMDWSSREIELIEMPPSRFETSAPAYGPPDDPERRERLAALVKKERLSAAEQVIVLQALSDGLDF